MTTRTRMWFGILISATLLSIWLGLGLLISAQANRGSFRVGLFLGILALQACTAGAVFYTASKIALYRYEVSFQERLRAQLRGMREGIDEMKVLVGRLDAAFDKRSKDLTEEVAAAVRDALAREREVP